MFPTRNELLSPQWFSCSKLYVIIARSPAPISLVSSALHMLVTFDVSKQCKCRISIIVIELPYTVCYTIIWLSECPNLSVGDFSGAPLFYTPHLWCGGCNSFDIVCECVSVSACLALNGQRDRHMDFNFGMEVKWNDIYVKFEGHILLEILRYTAMQCMLQCIPKWFCHSTLYSHLVNTSHCSAVYTAPTLRCSSVFAAYALQRSCSALKYCTASHCQCTAGALHLDLGIFQSLQTLQALLLFPLRLAGEFWLIASG